MNQTPETTATDMIRPTIYIPTYSDPLAPLCVLEQYCEPEPELYPAYIDIDTCDDEIEGGYNPEPGGVPERVWRDLVIRIAVPPDVSGEALEKYLASDEFLALYQRIDAGHTIEYRDHLSPVRGWGRQIGVIDDDAREAIEEVEMDIDRLKRVTVCTAYDAVVEDFEDEVTADTTDEELQKMAADLSKRCRDSGIAIIGGELIDELGDLRDEAA